MDNEAFEAAIYEDILADAYAGINSFGQNAPQYAGEELQYFTDTAKTISNDRAARNAARAPPAATANPAAPTEGTPKLSDKLVSFANDSSFVYDAGTATRRSYENDVETIKNLDTLSENEKAKAIQKAHELRTAELKAKSEAVHPYRAGPAVINQKQRDQGDKISRAVASSENYIESLKTQEQKAQKASKDNDLVETLRKAEADGLKEITIGGKTYYKLRKNWTTQKPKSRQAGDTTGQEGTERYSVGYTENNTPVAIIESDILEGVPENQWNKTVIENLRKKFPDGVIIGNNQIDIDSQSEREITRSRDTERLKKYVPDAYADKLRMTNNADDILSASRDYVEEEPGHNRKDFVSMARGTVLIRVGVRDYRARVITGTRANGKTVLYDIISMKKTSIPPKEAFTRTDPSQRRRQGIDDNGSISNADEGVKGKFSLADDEIIQQAKEYFGNTYKWSETGYITPDGKRLDFSGKSNGAPGNSRTSDHRDIWDAYAEPGEMTGTQAMIDFMSRGNIRISPENGGVNLSVMPTKQQLTILRDFIDKNRGEIILDFDDVNGDTVSSTEYPARTSASKILSDISNYFETGAEPTVSDVQKFRFSLNENFEDEYDRWLTENPDKNMPLSIGTTSNILKSIGVKNQNITWDTMKIRKIKNEHSGMTDAVIKQVPELIENPRVVMQSRTVDGRITMFGDVYDTNGKPVLAVLELMPDSHGISLDEIKVASAYGKDGAQNLLDKSRVLYIESDKKKADTWLKATGLQLPFAVKYGYNGKITYPAQDVNSKLSLADDYSELRSDLRSRAVTLPENNRAELDSEGGYETFRRKNMNRLKLVKNGGMPVDMAYADLRERYGAGLFPESIVNPADQLIKMAEVAETYSAKKTRVESEKEKMYYNALNDAAQAARNAGRPLSAELENELAELRELYGELTPGERPAREVHYPKRTTPDTRVRLYARTAGEAGATADMQDELARAVLDGKLNYTPISNDTLVERVNGIIAREGFDKAYERFRGESDGVKIDKDAVALGEALITAAAAAKNTEAALDLIQRVALIGTEAGRTVQAMRLLKRMDGAGQPRGGRCRVVLPHTAQAAV
jgi:hypothetical protein